MTDKKKTLSHSGTEAVTTSASEANKKIQALEQIISQKHSNIKIYEEKLRTINEELNKLIKFAVETKGRMVTKSVIQKVQQKNKEEEELEALWRAERIETDDLVKQLRIKYCDAIKAYHLEVASKKTISAASAPVSATPRVQQIDMSRSHLFATTIGTASAGHDEVDWHVMAQFSDWKISSQDINIDHKAKLGESEFATVFKGKCGGQEVAVKVLKKPMNNQEISELEQQCKKLKAVFGPGSLLMFLGASIATEPRLLVFELGRKCLATAFSDPKFSLNFERKIKITEGIVRAMAWLHNLNEPMLHLRLKPSNLVLTRDNRVKVADYGRPFNLTEVEQWRGGYVPFMAPELLQGNTPTTKCDVYSFGMCILYLFTQQIPYSHLRTYQETLRHILSEKKIPEIPLNIPSTLSVLIERCLSVDKSQRPEFEEISNEKWDSMLMEAVIRGEEDAMKMWMSCGTEEERKFNKVPSAVPWDTFVNHFCEFLGIKTTKKTVREDKNFKCLMAVLGIPFIRTVNPSSSAPASAPSSTPYSATSSSAPSSTPSSAPSPPVTFDNFKMFLKWFGPIRKDDGKNLLRSITALLKEPWFHGDISRQTAESRISAAAATSGSSGSSGSKNRSNLFLVRFSSQNQNEQQTKYEKFTISWWDTKKKEFAHMRINEEFTGLLSYVTAYANAHKLSPVSYERGFAAIFDANEKVEYKGYTLDDLHTLLKVNLDDGDKVGKKTSLEATWVGTTKKF